MRIGHWVAALGLLASVMAHAEVKFDVEGVSGDLKKNVELYLSVMDVQQVNSVERFNLLLDGEIRSALKALGYYSPRYEVRRDKNSSAKKVTKVIIDLDAGLQTRIAKSEIALQGGGNKDADLLRIIANSQLTVGQPLHHGHYEAFKSAMINTALKKGYFDARFTTNKMQVAPSKQQAFLTLTFDTGERYRFGDTKISGSQIKLERVKSMLPYGEGEYYDASLLTTFNQRLSNSQWYASIFVEPKLDLAHDHRVPIHVSLTPQMKNQVEVGVGYSTDVGPRLKLNWRKPWVHSRGHSWTTHMELSQVQPKVETIYRIPLDDVMRDYYQILGGLRYIDSHDTVSTEISAAVERHWVLDSGWTRTAFVRYLWEDYKQGSDEAGIMQLFVPGISFSRSRAKEGTLPPWADKQTISMEYADPILGSDTEILRFRGRTGWIRSWNNRVRGLVRVDGGAVVADGITNVPPSMRFFAGGDNSLRGYGYETIAPLDSGNRLRGGRFLVTSTLESQLRLVGNWWIAAFYDVGDAWNDEPDWKRAVGGGIRWGSPVGPVRLDIAKGLDNTKDDYRIHFTLGPEF